MNGKKSGDTWVVVLVAIIGLAGSLGGAYITAGKRFDQSFNEIREDLKSIQARSDELEKATDGRLASLVAMQERFDKSEKSAEMRITELASSSQVQVGHFNLAPSPNWSLNQLGGVADGSNKNVREVRERIQFNKKYPTKPRFVATAINTLDAHPEVRLSVIVESWDSEGATFAIRTWDKSLVHNVGVTWIAVP